ncbi:hypothetical protein ACLB1S_29565 [Escherichia coli]
MGICTSLPTSYKAVRATRRCYFTMVTFASIIGSVIVSPLTRRFDTVKIYYYTNLLLAALAVLMWFLPSGPAYQTLWLAVILR